MIIKLWKYEANFNFFYDLNPKYTFWFIGKIFEIRQVVYHSIGVTGCVEGVQEVPKALVGRPFAALELGMLTRVVQLPDVVHRDLAVSSGVHLLESFPYILLAGFVNGTLS